ncbi:NnrU [Macleaya cordata]|uniref:NnrU n=1 Tax=Macleaya cordata TaxID=56857 RepID=A0A200R8L8_MACCD|nr:NnrU [Macleaya cordata]
MASPLLLSNPIFSFSHLSYNGRPLTSNHTLTLSSLNPIKIPNFDSQLKKNPKSSFISLQSYKRKIIAGASVGEREEKNSSVVSDDEFQVGEDSAFFDLGEQKITSWVYFTGILGAVLFALDVIWIDSSTGVGLGKAFVDSVSGISESHEIVMLILIFIFAAVHSGMASFRDMGEKLIGERAYRVLFAGISLPLAVSTVVYFINHRYDGMQLWQLQSVPGLHQLVWISNFISFFFLYPSTFNLLEVAAVDKPKMHLWETGIMRITRHPQMVGQVIWCLAHTVWIGNSVAVATSIGLIGHHLFGVWNGDRRLASSADTRCILGPSTNASSKFSASLVTWRWTGVSKNPGHLQHKHHTGRIQGKRVKYMSRLDWTSLKNHLNNL